MVLLQPTMAQIVASVETIQPEPIWKILSDRSIAKCWVASCKPDRAEDELAIDIQKVLKLIEFRQWHSFKEIKIRADIPKHSKVSQGRNLTSYDSILLGTHKEVSLRDILSMDTDDLDKLAWIEMWYPELYKEITKTEEEYIEEETLAVSD